MKTKSFRIIIAIVLVFWMTLIFTLSAQTASESTLTSADFTYRVFSLVYPDFNEMTPEQQQTIISEFSFIIRKAAHFTLYFVLGILAFLNTAAYPKIVLPLKGLISFVFSALYAASDEFHQLYVPGRAGQLRDIAIDSAGALLSILISMLIYKGVDSKMRKKTLMKQNSELFDRLNEANARIAELELELKERDGELESLNDEVMALRRELACKPAEQEISQPIEPATGLEPEPEVEDTPEEEVEPEIVEEPSSEPERKVSTPTEESVEYGSQVIGKIVVRAASFSNQLTADGDGAKRELVNLILGRTEVAKAEILDITASEAETAVKKQMIDKVYEESIEYFGSVMAQI